ncbi:hypothetical protein BC940DRAFT_365172 [Gongronella butleri]|nr:hypothetical protein BC940DRAFT_365172 [Gongronella butleri]
MPASSIQVQILPETSTIHLYRDNMTDEYESYDLRGQVRLIPIVYKHAKESLAVHHIHLRIQGFAQTMLTSDFSDSDDEGQRDTWCKDSTSLTLLDRFLYSARGYANVTECVLDQEMTMTLNMTELATATDVPFRFSLENTRQLPPSVRLPRHLIAYHISAYVHTREEDVCHHCKSYLKKKRRLLKRRKETSIVAKVPITVACHDLRLSYNEPRIRYCGARPNCLRYQVHVAKFFPYEDTSLQFHCTFVPSSPTVQVRKVAYYLVQCETYPAKPGRMKSDQNALDPLQTQTRNRKLGYKEVDVSTIENFDHIPFTLDFDQPQFSQPIHITSLQIQHKLRILIYFAGKEKKMALSFPVIFCTTAPVTTAQPFFLSHMSSSLSLSSINNNSKLPTYLDVMKEGAPPSPFGDEVFIQ